MTLDAIDWTIIVGFLVVTLAVGLAVTKRAGRSSADFFLAGRGMPWWLLGMSMVATTFSAGTPNFVTDVVRQQGVAGNWIWWAFLLTGMMTVFVYAKLWRRSGVMTDIEFYELRYSGRPAAFLRGFRALYLGVLFNVIVLASANLAAIKIAGAMIGTTPIQTILVAGLVTAIYSMLGGLTGVLITDFLLFVISMGGAIAAAVYLLNLDCVGGLSSLLAHDAVRAKLSMFPDWHDPELVVSVFAIPLAVQWWSVWYPGAEPGGGGYIAQRMLAAKNELHATGATLLFNVAHYALRPWPWILVAFCSIIVFPDLESLRAAFPHMPEGVIKHDLAYPAMMTLLPSGLRGLVLASLMAAFMSTLSTHLNWGSSYLVNDFYKRFVRPGASEKELVLAGRISTLLTMVAAALAGLALSNALQVFRILLQVGAGTGLLFLLRWFWWRINAFSEIAAMIVSFLVAVSLEFFGPEDLPSWAKIVVGVGITTIAWLVVTLVTRPTEEATLRRFCELVRPGGPGWAAVLRRAAAEGRLVEEARQRWNVPMEIVCMLIGSAAVYSVLIATGYWIYGNWLPASVLTAVAAGCTAILIATWKRVNVS
ncbi:MAG TPA: sodium:solute symporter family protein [Thermoguttaceae bacterium]|nr:sodium:solute symporter family protein [Thermoguttaceae bacterium]